MAAIARVSVGRSSRMVPLTNATTWAQEQFGQAALGHVQRTRRLLQLAHRCAVHPEGRLPAKLDPASLKALYRWADRPEVTLDAVQMPHRQHTLAQMRTQPLVLLLHDTTT